MKSSSESQSRVKRKDIWIDLAMVLPWAMVGFNNKGKQKENKKMKSIMAAAALTVCVGAMISFAGCKAKAPDEVAVNVLKTLQTGKATPEFLAKNCTETAMQLFAMFGSMVTEDLKGATFTVVETKIEGDAAIVTIRLDGCNEPRTQECDLVRADGNWKFDVNKEKQASRDKKSAEAAVMACVDAGKKGLLTKPLANKFFYCQGEEQDLLIGIFNPRLHPEVKEQYNECSTEEKTMLDKKLEEYYGQFKIASSSFNTDSGYAVIGIACEVAWEGVIKLKVVKDAGEWKIGIYEAE